MRYNDLLEAVKKAPELIITDTNDKIGAIFTTASDDDMIIAFAMHGEKAKCGVLGSRKYYYLTRPEHVNTLLEKVGLRKEVTI